MLSPDKRYIDTFFTAFAKRISLNTSYSIEKTDGIKDERKKEVSYETTLVNIDDPITLFKKNQFTFNPAIVKRFEYDIEVIETGNMPPQIKDADKIIIHPIEVGNKIEFRKKKDSETLLEIPIRTNKKIETISATEGKIRKKHDLMFAIIVESQQDGSEYKAAIIDVEDKYVHEILGQVQKLKELENDYWNGFEL